MEATIDPKKKGRESGTVSLPEANNSISVSPKAAWLRKVFAFAGPGYLVSVGYMDPGNWGTDMAGGSRYGYALLWVIFLSNLMAQFLQVLCAKLGLVTGKDLAMACRDYYKRPAAIAMWLLCEVAIIACDLAEVVGSAVALNLLWGIRLEIGVLITGADVLLLLALMRFGFRKIEAVVLSLVLTVLGCFAYEVVLANPHLPSIFHGTFVPSMPGKEALLISLGILGATVMPHNLYLHSSIVQTRKVGNDPEKIREAIKFNRIDTIMALSLAFFVNASILILAASVFRAAGTPVDDLRDGHKLLSAALGGASATAFAVALLASGQSSTITGTLAGQIVMEGFMRWRMSPWARRLLTRSLAIIPAIIIISTSGGESTVQLLVISQVVLSMQLPFAIFPLVMVTSDKKRMGQFANAPWVSVLGILMSVVIGGLNLYLLFNAIGPLWLGALIAAAGGFAVYVMKFYKAPTPAV